MRRRDVLLTCAGACALPAAAGCATRDGVRITERLAEPQYDTVVVEVWLRNRGKPPARATLHVSVEMNAGDSYEKAREVRVTPGAQGGTSERFRFDVGRDVDIDDYSIEAWLSDVSYEGETTANG